MYKNSEVSTITCFEVNMKVVLVTFSLLPSHFWELEGNDAQKHKAKIKCKQTKATEIYLA